MAKPKVKKIVLFWLDNIPEKRDAQAIADLLPLQMHRELVFETTQAVNDKISGKSVLKLMDKFIIPVSARLATAVLEKKVRIKKEEFSEIAGTRAMHIAVMKTILERLKKNTRTVKSSAVAGALFVLLPYLEYAVGRGTLDA